MNVLALQRALRQLRCSGIAAGLDAQVQPGEFKALVATIAKEPEKAPKGRRAYVPRA